MNKLFGFTTLLINGESLPIKFGTDAIANFLKEMGISLSEISTLFTYLKIEKDGKEIELPVPVEPFKFSTAMLWAGADYVNRFEGGEGFRMIDASNWLDELGGLDAEELKPVYKAFWMSIKNGGAPPKNTDTAQPNKKKAKR